MRRTDSEARERQKRLVLKRIEHEVQRKEHRKAKRLGRDLEIAKRRRFARKHGIRFDGQLAREQIILPRVVSLHDNYAETLQAILSIREAALHRNVPVMVHFSHVEELDPAAALVLVAEMYRIRHLRSREAITGTYPVLRRVYDLLTEMGFYQLLNVREKYGQPEDTDDPDRPIFLRFLTQNKVESELVDSFVAVIEKQLMPMNLVARGKLVGAIIEAMNNTLDHAHPVRVESETMTHRWWMSSWINIGQKEAMIMLFDQGVGIPNSLEPSAYEKIRAAVTGLISFKGLTSHPTDGEMIMAATELHRTSTGQSGRGKGFRNMKQFVNACADGELRVLSNRGRYSYIRGTEGYQNESGSLGGTVIEWRFRHHGAVEMDDE